MIEWFNHLDIAWQTAIFVSIIAIAIAVIGGVLKLFFRQRSKLDKTQMKVFQKGSEYRTSVIDGTGNTANIAGRDIHTGVDQEVLKTALNALNKALEMIDTDKSKNLMSELNNLSSETLSDLPPIKHEQKIQLEKEFQLYGELWKALVDLKSSIIITPTLDIMPNGRSPYDIYNERCDIAIDAFKKAKNLFENNRPFYHGDVGKITKEFLGQCRGYIYKVKMALNSERFDDRLYDEAEELHEIIHKAIDEIEKAIKVRIGILPMSEIDDSLPIGPGLGTIVEITEGSIIYQSNTLNFRPLTGLKMPIIGGYVKRNDLGKLEAYIQTDMPFQSLQRLNEKLGLDSIRLLSESDTISEDISNPVVFTSSTSHILPQGEMVLNLSTWQEEPLPMNMHVQTKTTASGHLKGKVFQGTFEAILIYHEINLKIGLSGDFQVHLT